MRRHRLTIAFAAFLLVTSHFATRALIEGEHINTGTNHPVASIQDTEAAAQRDARFGMFIHWGLYSIPDLNEMTPRGSPDRSPA